MIFLFIFGFACIGNNSDFKSFGDVYVVNTPDSSFEHCAGYNADGTCIQNTDKCDATHCSFLEALRSSGTNPGTDTILFSVKDIEMPSYFLDLKLTKPVIIDGGGNTVIRSGFTLLNITAGHSTIKGLTFSEGVSIILSGNGGNTIQGNKLGTDITGNNKIGDGGIFVDSSNNVIGGDTPGSGNVIEILYIDNGSDNKVQGNYIGTDASGTKALGNPSDGILILGSSSNNVIGEAWS